MNLTKFNNATEKYLHKICVEGLPYIDKEEIMSNTPTSNLVIWQDNKESKLDISVVFNTYYWLLERCVFAETMNRSFKAFARNIPKEDYWQKAMEGFPDYLRSINCEVLSNNEVLSTVNGSVLSTDIRYLKFREGNKDYAIIQPAIILDRVVFGTPYVFELPYESTGLGFRISDYNLARIIDFSPNLIGWAGNLDNLTIPQWKKVGTAWKCVQGFPNLEEFKLSNERQKEVLEYELYCGVDGNYYWNNQLKAIWR